MDAQIASIDGRLNDAFINREGRKVPAGSVLDITYRWMFDSDLHLKQFELVQKGADLIETTFVLGDGVTEKRLSLDAMHLTRGSTVLENGASRLREGEYRRRLPPKTGKRRPIPARGVTA